MHTVYHDLVTKTTSEDHGWPGTSRPDSQRIRLRALDLQARTTSLFLPRPFRHSPSRISILGFVNTNKAHRNARNRAHQTQNANKRGAGAVIDVWCVQMKCGADPAQPTSIHRPKTRALAICNFCHAPRWGSMMSTICCRLTWFAKEYGFHAARTSSSGGKKKRREKKEEGKKRGGKM